MPRNAKLQRNVVKTVAVVADKLEDSQFKIRKSKEFVSAVEYLNEYFDTNECETWLLCVMLALQVNDDDDEGFSFSRLARFLGCSTMMLLGCRAEIETLFTKGYIYNEDAPGFFEIDLSSTIRCSEELLSCVFHDEKPSIMAVAPKKDVLDMVKEIGGSLDRFRRVTTFREPVMAKKEKRYAHEPFVIETKKLLPGQENFRARVLFYACCAHFLEGEKTILDTLLSRVYVSTEKFSAVREFMDESHILFKMDLIAFDTKGTITEATLEITQKAKEMLLGENLDLFTKTAQGMGIIQPDAITAKELFYDPENEADISRLAYSLQEENLCKIQSRLSEKGLSKGIAVLLYGVPGTGKTETVYQLAKAAERQIVHVDISKAKSAWFGESEKKIKKIFTDYRQLCRSSRKEKNGKAPILLFNEADAIFSKRKDSNFSNVAQTENAIQNIILEEMEKLDGILIATTNLADNLDAAFERRFLFKIKFENPSVEAKRKIWKSKLDFLDERELTSFAENYDLSGGQIDNIVRKALMDEILTGVPPTVETLHELCKHEKIGNGGSHKIGFCC